MNSSVFGLIKSSYDWFKECFCFLFFKEKPIKTVSFVNNIIIFLSKHQSNNKLAFSIFKSILLKRKNENVEMQDKRRKVIKEMKKNNSNINLISYNDEILYFHDYLKKNNISPDKLNITNISSFNKKLLKKIHTIQNRTRWLTIIIFMVSLFLSIINPWCFLLLSSIPFIIYIIKSQKFYRLYNTLKLLNTQNVNIENSIYYTLIKENDENWFSKINKRKHAKSLKDEDLNNKDKKNAQENVLLEKIKKQDLIIKNINDSELSILAETDSLGVFTLTKELKNIKNEKQELIVKTFDYILKNEPLKKCHLLQNIWKIIKNDNSSTTIKNWLKLNSDSISNIINFTNNKINLLHIFSAVNRTKQILSQNQTDKNNAVINNLNEIEDIMLKNMNLTNFIDIFETIETKTKSNSINLINAKV